VPERFQPVDQHQGARSGIAIAKATTQIIPAMSREALPTNGRTRTTPIAINPP
jgi:hypothetical protein